ncbi:MAG: ATP-binding cassette domain-containing protein [Acetobacteraceae bacterium]|jgi:ATP-binding cassette subfamily C protein|nr:ATP-binding cassette domain-containing protein [Acetobacteraceae bacterium]
MNALAAARGVLMLGLATTGALTFGVTVGVLVVPLYDMHLFDGVLTSRSLDTLTFLSVLCVIGLALYGVVMTFRGLVLATIGDRVSAVLAGPASVAGIRRAVAGDGRAAARALADVQEIRLFFGGGAAAAPFDLLCAPVLLAVIFMLHPALGWFAVGAALLMLAFALLSDSVARPALAAAQGRMDGALGDAAGLLRDPVLREGMGMGRAIARRWQGRQAAALAALGFASRRGDAVAGLSRLVRGLLQGGMLGFAALLVLRNEATPGVLIGANLLLALLLAPFDQVIAHWRSVAAMRLAWRRLSALLATEPVGEASAAAGARGLVLSGVTFQPARASAPVLDDVTLVVEPGTMAVVTGPNGAGKSSLARIAAGVFPPTHGVATVDGEAAVAAAAAGRVGFLPQRPQLLEGTVGENIGRFREASGDAVVEAARRAGLHAVIGRLAQGYATPIGPEDPLLSGGERQRLALARALHGAPPLLVLDEPDASLDHAGEAVLIEALEAARREGAAILAITHRRGLAAIADDVWRLDRGRLSPEPHRGLASTAVAREAAR